MNQLSADFVEDWLNGDVPDSEFEVVLLSARRARNK